MSLINIISALGNNNSIYPLIVRDCGIENLAKCYMTYKQNAKESKIIAREATRERIVDEYGTSAVWLGGIPLMQLVSDKFIESRGLSSKVDMKLFKETSSQGIDINIQKFKNLIFLNISNLLISSSVTNKFPILADVDKIIWLNNVFTALIIV